MNPFLETPKLRLAFVSREYVFRKKITTSRGSTEKKTSWFVLLFRADEPEVGGLGEVSPLPGLSLESGDEVERQLEMVQKELNAGMAPDWASLYSSVRFGIESALADLGNGGFGLIYDSPFSREEKTISINGLVWMADPESMLEEAERKVSDGFRCLKFKIGQLPWEAEQKILAAIRSRFSQEDLEIRVDANGAYRFETAMPVLMHLARQGVHSIEQPVMPADTDGLKKVIRLSPVPIALDEQLIGLQDLVDERVFLRDFKPHYLVMKPTLIGGFEKTRRWIGAAEEQGVGWWITSSLETPIGLNALAQFSGMYSPLLPQGLSTGRIFMEEFLVPVYSEGPYLRYSAAREMRSIDLFQSFGGRS